MAASVKKLLTGASIAALGVTSVSPTAIGAPEATGIGAIRSPAGEFANGLDFFVSETLRYESNLVRTANDAETAALYQTTDSSDFISLTEATVSLTKKRDRSKLTFKGNLGYEVYNEFDQFNGLYGGGSGEYVWQFTQRCQTNIRSGIDYVLASFNDSNQARENRQTRVSANAGASCFVLDRLRLSADLFGGTIDNDEDTLKFNDLNYKGYQAAIAYVTAKKNEIGFRYQKSTTERPNLNQFGDPVADQDNFRYELFGKYNLGEKLNVGVGVGLETQDDGTSSDDTDRTYSRLDVSWFPSDRVAVGLDFARGIEDVDDFTGVTAESDKYGASVNWKFHPRATLGAYLKVENDTLGAPIDNPNTVAIDPLIYEGSDVLFPPDGVAVDGTKEDTITAGASLRHGVAGIVDVVWTLGYTERSSDYFLREYDGTFAAVTIGAKF